jgi:AcrR family transcriptional regulator
MSAGREQVELLEKNKPRQARAKRTYEAILEAAAGLLVEIGVERISTNLIAERAGITVPALYRYFPNKYAVLYALGAKLMDRQNRIAADWYDTHVAVDDPRRLVAGIYSLLRDTYEGFREQRGALEILQALRAVAPLRELRLRSRRLVSEQLAVLLAPLLPRIGADALAIQSRLSVEMGYDVIEMALEEQLVNPDVILSEGARMIGSYWAAALEDTR